MQIAMKNGAKYFLLLLVLVSTLFVVTSLDLVSKWDKGNIPNNEYTFTKYGEIEFYGVMNENALISLYGTNGSLLARLASADRPGSDRPKEICAWDDAYCIIDRNGRLLFAADKDDSINIDNIDYNSCPNIICGINGHDCTKQEIEAAAKIQGTGTSYACLTKPLKTTILPGEKIVTKYSEGGRIGIAIYEDLTAPASVSNLQAGLITNSSITWSWTNPSDADFNSAIIYLNNVNIANTSASTYTALNLISNTTYTLGIKTKDNSGNVNNNLVFNSAKTLATIVIPNNNTNQTTGNETNQTILPNIAPFITINHPLNATYSTNLLLLDVTSNGSSIWYTINSGANQVYTAPTSLYFPNGTNTLIVYANNTFNNITSKSLNFFIISNITGNETNQTIPGNSTNVTDTTPPASISNIGGTAGTNFIYLNWTNPSDADFNSAIIYLNNVNIANTSAGNYNITGLQQNTTYTILIKTKDNSGNVNNTGVSVTITTLSASSGTNNTNNTNPCTVNCGGNNGGSSSSNGRRLLGSSISEESQAVTSYSDEEEIIDLTSKSSKVYFSFSWLWVLLILSLILLIIIILVLTLRRN